VLVKTWTHRQYLVALAWLELDFSIPQRSDVYLSQIAAGAVKKVNHPWDVQKKVESKVSKGPDDKPHPWTVNIEDRIMKSKWLAIVGFTDGSGRD
jgi:hypothetical protein